MEFRLDKAWASNSASESTRICSFETNIPKFSGKGNFYLNSVAACQLMVWCPTSGVTTAPADPATQGAREGRGPLCHPPPPKKKFTTVVGYASSYLWTQYNLLRIVRSLGGGHYDHVLQPLQGGLEFVVTAYATVSDWFAVASGVRQGCRIAPDLFLGPMMERTVHRGMTGVTLGKEMFTDLDWVSCIADCRRQLSCVGEGVYSDATQLNSTSSWVVSL